MAEKNRSIEEIKSAAETLADTVFFQLKHSNVPNEVIGWTAINLLFSAAVEKDICPIEFQLTCKLILSEYTSFYHQDGSCQ